MATVKNNLDYDETILSHYYKNLWLKANRGIFVQVAKQLSRKKPISNQMIRMVYFGERRSQRVERVFRRLRAPGFELPRKASAPRKAA
jgi:hypothetical protein